MITRRQLLSRALGASSLVALGSVVPQFVARTAQAATVGKDNILVVVELTGGNDGINTVIPYADDLYHKLRPTLRQTKDVVIRLDDHVGLHPKMESLRTMWGEGQLAVVQGVGYPNPDRSHFEAMDIWQSGDPKRLMKTGWLGRSVPEFTGTSGGVPLLQVGRSALPLALQGNAGGAVSVNDQNSFRLEITGGSEGQQNARRRLLKDLSTSTDTKADDLASFVRRRHVQTLTAVETLRELMTGSNAVRSYGNGLSSKLQLIAGLIERGFGTRVFYVNLEGFDTHAGQALSHSRLLAELADSINSFFNQLKGTNNDKRVRLLTFSEFGRRADENGSQGTDHGAASCLFVAGPSVKGGVVGKHPSLSDLDVGDLKYHTDFRRVYATMLDGWLECDSKTVLGEKWEPVKELMPKA